MVPFLFLFPLIFRIKIRIYHIITHTNERFDITVKVCSSFVPLIISQYGKHKVK